MMHFRCEQNFNLPAGRGLVPCGCHKAPPPAGRPPTPVAATAAARAAVPVMVEAFGRLRALNDINIQPQVAGKIIEALYRGAEVEQGSGAVPDRAGRLPGRVGPGGGPNSFRRSRPGAETRHAGTTASCWSNR